MLGTIRSTMRKPTAFLMATNIGCALIGFTQGLVILRLLGANQYGVVAVIVGIAGTAANFVDLRLSDLIAKLYYAMSNLPETERGRYRASVLRIGVGIQLLLGVLLGLIALLLSAFLLHLFTETPVAWNAIVSVTTAQALLYVSGLFSYLQRFSERFFVMGSSQIVGTALGATLLVWSVYDDPSPSGYGRGLLLSTTLALLFSMGLCWYLWRRVDGLPIFGPGHRKALCGYLSNIRFLLTTNVLGYSKLLHRAADVLLVGFFCNDRQTGWYKLARSLTDSLLVLFDAANKVFQPLLLSLLSKDRLKEYKAAAVDIFRKASLFTGLVILGEIVLLPWLVTRVLGADFAGVEPIIVILTIPFLFVAGIFLWLWPLIISKGGIGRYTVYNILAVVLGQYGLSIALLYSTGQERAVWFGIGYAAVYPILYVLALADAAQRHPRAFPLPFFGRSGSGA